jgi:predicted DCC family thiol-disulfide oxidoreductase YuxK
MNMDEPRDTLPRPETDRRDVVIYDADCPICRRAARRLHRWDWRGRLAFLPLDDPEVARRWDQLSRDQLQQAMHVMTADGRAHRGAAAVRVLARRVPALWPIVPLLHIPGSLPMWERLYRALAERRYMLAGRNSKRHADHHCNDDICR